MKSSLNQGSNLYPQELKLQFGSVTMELDVPKGVWNPTPPWDALG